VYFSCLSPDPPDLRKLRTPPTKMGTPLKSGYFTDIGSHSMKTVADRHRHAAYHNKHW